ncbi:UDP-glucose--hexose-1-phosphate uridylyltransferase [Trifolium repens]|nr:UDP-glucose--hexose-1-phosphate uridylyltransferase [Trifolium repens]
MSSSSSSSSTSENQNQPQLRKDPIWNRWVIFSPARSKRPSDFKSKSSSSNNPNNPTTNCPFCIGNEHQCAPEIFRVPSDDPNWKIRVIQNLFPALSRELVDPVDGTSGSVLDGFGFHDVVIETPVHSVQLCDLENDEIGEVFVSYTRRIQQLVNRHSIKYVQVFKNHGAAAGASMSHSHSQMIALPVIPPSVSARLGSMKDFFDQTGKCCICEIQRENLLIDSSTYFFSLVPYAASFPFEIWIIPRYHSAHFHELDAEKAVDLGGLLKQMLKKISVQLNDPPFNFMIHTSPLHGNESELAYTHWFIQIVPQLVGTAGFELATGCYINPVFPEDAAKVLREVNVSESE